VRLLRTETAIVGGGLMGCWTAYFLRKRGLQAVVLEKGAVGAQASGVNLGNVRLQGRFAPQIPLALRAHALWETHEALVGDACEFRATGHLRIALAPEERRILQDHAREAAAHGLDLQILDGGDVRRRWPWLNPLVAGASWSPRDGAANPRRAGPAVARAARALGAEILEGVKITGIERTNGRFRLTTDRDLAVESDRLVNAAGAWAAALAAAFGEVVPIIVGGPAQFVTDPVPFFIEPIVQAVDGTIIFRQTPRGNVLATGYPRGASDPVANRAPVDPAKTLAHMARLAAIAPALAPCQVIRVWSGIEAYAPDMLPVLGPSARVDGLFHAFGFSGHGFQLAPGVGLVMSELVADGTSPTPLAPFSIARFEGRTEAGDRLRKEFDEAAVAPRRPA
jgi:sarcosine oxidase subunit beta